MSWAEELGADEQWSWAHARGELSLDRPGVMAILNLTPDSFSDGGRFEQEDGVAVDAVAAEAAWLLDQGADVLDVGGESTRPGAARIPPEIEQQRILLSISRIAKLGCPVSVDTRNAATAEAAMAAGASIINDVSGLADPHMAEVAAASNAGLVIGHLRGVPSTMQDSITFSDVVGEVARELSSAVARARRAGVRPEAILVDPGVGFGKSATHSAALVASAGLLRARTGCRVLIGASRKSFLRTLRPPARPPAPSDAASVAAALIAVQRGASLVRVHDVASTALALSVRAGIIRASADAVRHGGERAS